MFKEKIERQCYIHKRIRERNDFDKIETTSRSKLNIIDQLIIKKLLSRNIKKNKQSIITTHDKKLQNLTINRSNPCTHEEIVKKLSTKNVSLEELTFLKFGLNHSLPPLK